ncbi:hypothetical protein ACWF94_21425 [Streptomyces sp. NPDC055078]
MSKCPYCGWFDNCTVQTVSSHPTAQGHTLWTRCACGSLQGRKVTADSTTVVVRGRPPGRHHL